MIATSAPNRSMLIAQFRCGDADLVLERTGRPGCAQLSRTETGQSPGPVAQIRYDPGTGALTDHWHRGAGAEDLRAQTIASWVAEAVPHLAAWSARLQTLEYRCLQRESIEDLVTFRLPAAEAAEALNEIEPAANPWRHLTRTEVCAALHRHLSGELSATDLQTWASTLYERVDVLGELDHFDAIGRVLRALAYPGGHLSLERPLDLLRALGLAPAPWYALPGVLGGAAALAYALCAPFVGAPPISFLLWTALCLALFHMVRFGRDRARFGSAAALDAARREALFSLPLCLTAMVLDPQW